MFDHHTRFSHLSGLGIEFVSALVQHLQIAEMRGDIVLEPFPGHRIGIASDYGGEHHGSRFVTTAVLLYQPANATRWLEARSQVRAKYLPGGRRIGYKELSDGYCQEALLPFLDAANHLPGLCVTFAIDKRIPVLFPTADTFLRDEFAKSKPQKYLWKPQVFEKLMRVTHFASILMALVSRPAQEVTWISDQDPIAANEDQRQVLPGVLRCVSRPYLAHSLGGISVATTARDDNTRKLEDLVAIPDIVAGVSAEIVTEMQLTGRLGSSIIAPSSNFTKKSEYVHQWLGMKNCPLAKLVWILRLKEGGTKAASLLRVAGFGGLFVPDRIHAARLRGRIP